MTRDEKSPVGRCIRGGKILYKRRERTMGVIAPGDKRREVASGEMNKRREEVIREDKGQ